MKLNSIETIIKALNESGSEYLIAGGLAVVAHGHVRFTADLDIIIHLEKENIAKALTAFKNLGYKPRAPVPIESFANESDRKSWIKDKGLKVFSLWSTLHPGTEIDIFVEEPIDFNKSYQRKKVMAIAPGIEAAIIPFDELIELKKLAGRPKDLEDVRNLLIIDKGEQDG